MISVWFVTVSLIFTRSLQNVQLFDGFQYIVLVGYTLEVFLHLMSVLIGHTISLLNMRLKLNLA